MGDATVVEIPVAELSRGERAALLRRLKRTQRIAHEGFARILSFARDRGADVVRLTVDLPDGAVPLAGRISPDRPMGSAEARRLARDLCLALARLHEEKLVHGSLDVSSVVVAGDRAVVVDLGSALAKQRGAAPVDERADVQAVGRILYLALTGKPPFDAETTALPTALRAQVMRCLQRDPERRYGSIVELAEALGIGAGRRRSDARPKRRGWRAVLVMLAIAALGAGGVVAWEWRQRAQANGEPPAAAAVDAGVAVADEVGVQARRRPVIEIASPVVTNGSSDDEILARGLREALVLGIGDSPDVELRPVAVESSLVAARRSGVVMVIGGQIERREGAILQGPAATIVISVKVLDVQSGALRFAERFVVAHQPDLAATIDTIVDKIRRATLADAAARPAPTPAKETAAFLDWARGLAAEDRGATYEAIASYHHAATEDPTFFPPRVRLIELGGTPDDPSFVDTTRQLAAGAGEWGAMTLRAALAPTPEERLVALEAIVARFPHDVHRSAALAVTYREVGRAADCLAVGQRALDAGASSELRRSLAWCAIESGDGDAAARIAAELATTDPAQGAVLLGDVHMLHGRFGKAREEYQRARDAGVDVSGRLAVVNLHAGGRCAQRKGPMPDGEEGRAWGTVDAACGRQRTNAAPRETKLPEKVLPIHRHPFLEPPVLIDVAIARAEAGDREDAALVCQEILAAAPSYAPGHYCLGRVAQAGKDWQAAFRSYREFLDRWADAAEENRMVRDATRRLNAVIRAARQESARQTP